MFFPCSKPFHGGLEYPSSEVVLLSEKVVVLVRFFPPTPKYNNLQYTKLIFHEDNFLETQRKIFSSWALLVRFFPPTPKYNNLQYTKLIFHQDNCSETQSKIFSSSAFLGYVP
jgi:hypothetical protein